MKRIVGTIVGVLFVLTISVASICLVSGLPGKGKYPIWNYEKTHREKGNYTVYDFEDVELMLPAEWEGKYGIERFEDHIDFFHSASRNAWEKYGTGEEKTRGVLFSLWCNFNGEYPENPNRCSSVGRGKYGMYYLRFFATEETYAEDWGYMEDTEIWNEWSRMAGMLAWVHARLQGETREQSGINTIPLDDFKTLAGAGGQLSGTLVQMKKDANYDVSEIKIVSDIKIKTDEGDTFAFANNYASALDIGDYVYVSYWGDLYGAPIIQRMKKLSSRESLSGEVQSIEGIYEEDADDRIFLDIGSRRVSVRRRPAPRPDEYELGDYLRIEYLGELTDPWMVRVEKIE